MYLRIFLVSILVALCSQAAEPAHRIPPLSKGVVHLEFNELLSGPVGERGLTLSDKAKSLEGKRVRFIGYMVRQDHSAPGMFLLSPVPVQTDADHYGLADDLPATTVFVKIGFNPAGIREYSPGPLLVTGIFRTGNQEEADGRISLFRVELDPPRKSNPRLPAPVPKTGATRLSRQLQKF
jgi:hypothetical protein